MKFNSEILDLETKIVELKNFSKEKNIDLSLEIEKLSKQRDEYLKAAYEDLTDWDRVAIARHPERPYTLDYIENMTTDFIELHGDRLKKSYDCWTSKRKNY